MNTNEDWRCLIQSAAESAVDQSVSAIYNLEHPDQLGYTAILKDRAHWLLTYAQKLGKL